MTKKEKIRKAREYFDTDHLKTDLKKHAIRGAGLALFSRGTSIFIQLFSTVVLARLLTPKDFGLVAMVLSIVGFFLVFRDMGLTDATIQQSKITHEQISTLFWINASFGVLITLMVISIAPAISWLFKEPALTGITILFSFSFILSGLYTQHLALLKRGMYFFQITVMEVVASIVSVIVTILMALNGFGYWALVARPLVLASIMALCVWYFCRWRPGRPSTKSGVGSMLRFGAHTLGYFIINYFALNLDKTLIGWRFGPIPLGFYHKSVSLSMMPVGQITIPLQSVAVTSLSKLKNEPAKYRRFFLNAIGMLSFVGMPICGFLAANSKDVVYFLLGSQWDKAAPYVTILSIGALIQLLSSTKGWLHVSLGHADRWFRWGLLASVVTVGAYLVGLPFGPKGVAVAYTVIIFILTGPALIYAGKPIGLTLMPIIDAVWRYFVASVAAGYLTRNIFICFTDIQWVIVRLLIFGAIFISLYLVFVILLYRSLRPIKQFFGHLYELVPDRFTKKPPPADPVDPI